MGHAEKRIPWGCARLNPTNQIVRHIVEPRKATMSHKVLITGATGDTGGVAVRESIKRGL